MRSRPRWWDRPAAIGLALVVAGCGSSPPSPPAVPDTSGPTAAAPETTAPTPEPTPVASAPTASAPGSAPPSLRLDVVAGGLSSPVDIADPGDGSGRRFVVEQGGRIRIVDGSGLLDQPFLDLTTEITSGGEQGLLGLAFHPDYPADPRLFVDYTDGNGDTVVSSFRVDANDPDRADVGSGRVLLHIIQPYSNHNGGALVFGPDGMLYIAMGDGGSGGDPHGNGQRTDTLLGKILRIDVGDGTSAGKPPYTVPADNPFVGDAGAEPEIWMTGLRNPWRIRFDPATDDLWIGDVGQSSWEEIDVARAGDRGLNFGWNRMEGFHCFAPIIGCDQAGLTMPVAEYSHELGCAVIGGVVVRDSRQPAIDGRYVFSDSCSGNLWLLDPAGEGRREPALAGQWQGSISSITQTGDGAVLLTDLEHGQLLSLSVAVP